MRLSFFSSARAKYPEPVEMSWAEFRDRVGDAPSLTPHPPKNKANLPAFSPAEFEGGAPRAAENVTRLHMVCLDYDDIDDETAQEVFDFASDFTHCIYTSYSHPGKDGPKFRLIFPLEESVPVDEWADFWIRVVSWVPGTPDLKCKDPSRLYFLPYTTADRIDQGYIRWHEGDLLSADYVYGLDIDLISMEPEIAAIQEREEAIVQSVSPGALAKLKPKGAMVSWIESLREGLPFAIEGSRHPSMLRITQYLEAQFPYGTVDSIADLFAPSVKTMSNTQRDYPIPETTKGIKDAIEGARRKRREKEAEAAVAKDEERRLRIKAAFGNTGRDVAYTTAELERFAADSGVTVAEFQKRWIISHGRATYTFINGKYHTPPYFTQENASAAFWRDLSPAPVELSKVVGKATVDKTFGDMIKEYGTVVSNVVGSLKFKGVRYDPQTYTMHQGFCEPVHVKPIFHEDIDNWLRLLAGDNYDNLLDWIQFSLDLEEPLCALYLQGEKGSGKSLLARCVASQWGSAPVDAGATGKSFNYLTENPVVLADEHIPVNWMGKRGSGEMRDFIAAPDRTVNRKFLPPLLVEGHMRVVFTANNTELLEIRESLTPTDRAAIIERIFHVEAAKEASAFLESIAEKVPKFIKDSLFAQHATWLRENRKAVRAGRFGLASQNSELHARMEYASDASGNILCWILGWLARPQPFELKKEHAQFIKIIDKEIYVNIHCMSSRDVWTMYVSNGDMAPSQKVMGHTLKQLSHEKKKKIDKIDYWHLKMQTLLNYNQYASVMSEEAVMEAIEHIEKLRSHRKAA